MKLIKGAKQCWRLLSMQAMGAALALQGAWAMLDDDMKASVPHAALTWATLALLVLGMLGRLVKQEQPPKDSP